MDFPLHTDESAPPQATSVLQDAKTRFGLVPNLYRVMAEAPEVLEAYHSVSDLFQQSSLGGEERHVVWLTISVEHQCGYCIPAHTFVAKAEGVTSEVVAALRSARPLPSERLEALRQFTLAVVRNRGAVSEQQLADFLEAGYTRQNAMEVILGIAQKTISNYLNKIARVPVDSAFASHAWHPDEIGKDS